MGRDSPTVSAVVYAVKNRSELEQFADEQPSTVKWSCMKRGRVNHYSRHGILVPADGPWSTRSNRQVWQLAEWVEDLLDSDLTLTTRQIEYFEMYGDDILSVDEEFVAQDTELAYRTLGGLHDHDLIQTVEDNRGWPEPTVWGLTNSAKRVRDFYDEW